MFIRPYPIRLRDTPAYYPSKPTVKVNVFADEDQPRRVVTRLVLPLLLVRQVHPYPEFVPGKVFNDGYEP